MTTPVAKDRFEPLTGAAFPGILLARLSAAASRARHDVAGATSIEYALITGLIFLAIVTGLQAYSSSVNSVYSSIETAIVKK